MAEVNPPPILRLPKAFLENPEIRTFFEQQKQILFQMWNRTGGSTDNVDLFSDHTELSNVGTNTHAQIDTNITTTTSHIADGTIHFTEGSVDHTNIQNIGTNTHAQIDTGLTNSANHIADTDIHIVTSTTTALEDVSDAINTTGKVLSKAVLNTTTGATVFASGTTAGAVWDYYDATTAHTPV